MNLLYRQENITGNFIFSFAAITALSILLAFSLEKYFLLAIPVLTLVGFIAIIDFTKIFYLLLFFIPLSTEVQFSSGLGTDLPTEPLIVLLMVVFLGFVLSRLKKINTAFFLHPISLLILLHLAWIFISSITSHLFLVSFKFFLAKCWYIITFYFLAGYLLKSEKAVKTLVWVVFIPLMFTVIVILIRHAQVGFAFSEINSVLAPFYRNHVGFASICALFFPFVALATGWYPKYSLKWWCLAIGSIILLTGIYFAYTRAAYVALMIALGAYFVIRFRLMKVALGLALIGAIAGISYLVINNKYLDYAPDFNKTVTHYQFDNLLEATYKGEDISTMERVYRWVAGFYMSKEELGFGYGPGNFVNFYKPYTVRSFQTYVSDNPERSGVHSYFLMTLIEQGLPGLLIFLLLSFYILIRGERIYHQLKDPGERRILLMCILCMVVIFSLLIINDMLETDKVGSFFFICIAIIVNMDPAISVWKKNKVTSETS